MTPAPPGPAPRTPAPRVALVGTLDTKGAEYAWTAGRLRDLGVDRGQGYYLGRPGRLEDLLARHQSEPGPTQAIRVPQPRP